MPRPRGGRRRRRLVGRDRQDPGRPAGLDRPGDQPPGQRRQGCGHPAPGSRPSGAISSWSRTPTSSTTRTTGPGCSTPILKGKAQVVYGSRFTGERKNMFPSHWLGNRFLTLVTNILYRSTLSDMETCYKLFDRRVLDGITIRVAALRLRTGDHGQGAAAGLPDLRGPHLLRRAGDLGGQEDLLARRFRGHRRSRPLPLHAGRSSTALSRQGRRWPWWWSTTTPAIPGRFPGHGAGRGCERRGRGRQRLRATDRLTGWTTTAPSGSYAPGPTSVTDRAPTAGVAVTEAEFVLVANPDVVVHPGALDVLAAAFAADPTLAIAGPWIMGSDGTRYPSARRFPSLAGTAVGHALLGLVAPQNRFSRRYRMADLDTTTADRRSTGCRGPASWPGAGPSSNWAASTSRISCTWRTSTSAGGPTGPAGRSPTSPAPWSRHVQGLSTGRRPYRMLLAHHRSALHFIARRAEGRRRLALPGVALVLAARLLVAWARQAVAPGGHCAQNRSPGRLGFRAGHGTRRSRQVGQRARALPEAAGSYRGQMPVQWYGSLVLIVLVGVVAIVYSRYEDQHPDGRPPTDDRHPLVRRSRPRRLRDGPARPAHQSQLGHQSRVSTPTATG